MAAPLPELPEGLIEDIFLRLPPDEPASLVRASLANRHWRDLLTGDRFRGEYRKFHGTPPVLGFFKTRSIASGTPFVPAESAGGFFTSRTDWAATKDYEVWDCRHGRVLLWNRNREVLLVWDPMTGSLAKIDNKPNEFSNDVAVVLCTVTGCDHSTCHEGPFKVFWAGVLNYDDDTCVVESYEYSPPNMAKCESWLKFDGWETWDELDPATHEAFLVCKSSVFIQDDAFYLMLIYGDRSIHILKYDLSDSDDSFLSVFNVPPSVQTVHPRDTILVAVQDRALGFAHLDGSTLNLWARKVGSDQVTTWTLSTSIDLMKTRLPIENPNDVLELKGSVEGTNVIFLTTNLGIYEINLKSLRWKEISKRTERRRDFIALIPYMRFYNPKGVEKGPDKEMPEQGCAASSSKQSPRPE